MSTPLKEKPRAERPPAQAELTPRPKGPDLDAITRHLKGLFREVGKTDATENPEFGCVAWYQYLQAPKDR
jgi:hypothetical protein